MIRYRPHRSSLSASLKEEQIFDSLDEMFSYLLGYCGRLVRFMSAGAPFMSFAISISEHGHPNPMVGYKKEHKVLISRTADKFHGVSFCIGYIDMEAI